MVSAEVKGQHVLLWWSVCVFFFCLLPAATANDQCMTLDFPTAQSPRSGQDVTIPVPVNQDVTIPFSIKDPCTPTHKGKLTVSVTKWNSSNNSYNFFCKIFVTGNRVTTLPANKEKCKDQDDKGRYSFTTFTGHSDQTWRWQVTSRGVTLINKTVQLHLQESRGRRKRSNAIANGILITGISVFSFIIVKLCFLLLRRKYRERRARGECCEGMSSRMRRRRRYQRAIQFRRDPPGCESESRSNRVEIESAHSFEDVGVNSSPQPQENEEPLVRPTSTSDSRQRSSDYAEYVTDVTLLPSS